MGSFSRTYKVALLSAGVIGGGYTYYTLTNSERKSNKFAVQNSWTTNFTPSVRWDHNWDHRDPKTIVKPSKGTPEDDNRYNSELEKAKPTATRHLILIRHGQYNLDGATDKERILTELGRQQASMTGKRLASLDIKWDLLIKSTMTRAQETAGIIAEHLPKDIEVRNCQLVEEGAPVPPEPAVGHWTPEPRQFFQDNARIEAAFRKYFHRASPDQAKDTYTIIVCHANVIRFIVCKALQFPPEGWLRIALNHGSVTWLSVHPNGHVILRGLGDSGYMDPPSVTYRNTKKTKVENLSESKKKLKII